MRDLLFGTSGAASGNLGWSPDGSRIVFTTGDWGRETEIYVMNADGSGQRNLTRHAGLDDFAGWSPDVRKIVFVSYRSGTPEIYVMKADGSGQRRLGRH